MDNIGTIFYEQSSLVGARLTDNDASPDLIDDKNAVEKTCPQSTHH
ncbi:hypothetical protein QZQ15_02625 [Serratia marcescens]|nr:hypothetical protein [Serratia marcescens]MDP8796894.1 hypothetical protein [Serratia marcescens]